MTCWGLVHENSRLNDRVKGNEEDKEKCEIESCGDWMPWAEWSQCLSIPQNYPEVACDIPKYRLRESRRCSEAQVSVIETQSIGSKLTSSNLQ